MHRRLDRRRFLPNSARLTLTLDYGHFVVAGEPADPVDCLLPHCSHLHARGGAAGKLQARMEENAIPFDALKRLLEFGYEVRSPSNVWTDSEACRPGDQ